MTAHKPEVHIMIDALLAQNRLPRAIQDKSAKLILKLKNDPVFARFEFREHRRRARPSHEVGANRSGVSNDRLSAGRRSYRALGR